ncbi:hypothetical protein B0H17DRAFT_1101189 [Mycena rosella]|uniref:CFEM domain-containing protein n=1 Tax=Mycena rosella TaxID=1033263 RepID=A0AAD7G2K0_MYCRO|nr:hypothetical protein B0H17DRAFT_1101189 [Mycena rosella]
MFSMCCPFKTLAILCLLATTLPQCAIGCARAAAIQDGCDLSDTPCLCKTAFSSSVEQCARTTSCSQAEQAQVNSILGGMCAAASGSLSASGSPSPRSFQFASVYSITRHPQAPRLLQVARRV